MRLVITHEQPDFDAIASVALALLAHPGSIAAVGGDMPDNVRALVHLYRDHLDVRDPDSIDLGQVRELIIVDTNDGRRIGRFQELLDKVPVTLYDHHPGFPGEISAAHGIHELVGATASLLTRHLRASSASIPPQIATLALLGIHEDTGNLTFDMTGPIDYRSAADLMSCGASLRVVREFASEYSQGEQSELLKAVREKLRRSRIADREIAAAALDYPRYVRHSAGITNRVLADEGVDAAVLAIRMEGKTLIFARSTSAFDVGAAVAALGGGGHGGAAFARSELPPQEALDLVLAELGKHTRPPLRARHIMSSPVKTVPAASTVHQAAELLTRFGHNGAPVVDETGKVTGVISRRDIERALRHDFGEAKVSGFASREVVRAGSDATVAELEALVFEHDIGRVPIVDDGDLVGIVTRTDLLTARHPLANAAVADTVRDRLPSEARRLLSVAARLLAGGSPPAALWLVGGTVRDALLGRALGDLDLVVEGVGSETVVGQLQRELGGTMTFHASFGTSSLSLPSGLTVDVAAAREEYYPHPGALPEVSPSSIRKDLARRDFTVNAMALRLWPEPTTLIDPYDGRGDLERKLLRPLHPLSFVEDPTRILRGARLAARLGFELAPSARRQAQDALQADVVERVSRSRLRAELELTLAEPQVGPGLRRLEELDAMRACFGLPEVGELVDRLDQARRRREVPPLSYLLALLVESEAPVAEKHVDSFHWPRRLLANRERVRAALADGAVDETWLSAADEAEIALVRAASTSLEAQVMRFEEGPSYQRIRGGDVLELGLPAGPEVGQVLAEVARARQQGQVSSWDEEMELARRLVQEYLAGRQRE